MVEESSLFKEIVLNPATEIVVQYVKEFCNILINVFCAVIYLTISTIVWLLWKVLIHLMCEYPKVFTIGLVYAVSNYTDLFPFILPKLSPLASNYIAVLRPLIVDIIVGLRSLSEEFLGTIAFNCAARCALISDFCGRLQNNIKYRWLQMFNVMQRKLTRKQAAYLSHPIRVNTNPFEETSCNGDCLNLNRPTMVHKSVQTDDSKAADTSISISRLNPFETDSPVGDCVICLQQPTNVLLLPCRHLCICNVCLTDNCPVCQTNVSKTIIVSI